MLFEIRNCSVLVVGADIIVNAANRELQAGGGVCGAIFYKAGYEKLQAECNKLAPIDTGAVAVTKGYGTGADYIIHAVGPIFWENRLDWKMKLKQVYWNSLTAADRLNCKQIAFPCISTGIYGCPLKESAEIVVGIIKEFASKNLEKVILCCYTQEEYTVYMDIVN